MRPLYIIIILFISCTAFSQRKKERASDIPQTQEDSVKFEGVLVEAEKQLILENYDEALENFTTALKMNSRSAAVHYKIATVLDKKEEEQKAIAYARKAIELDAENKFYRLSLARFYQRAGFFDNAVKTYEDLLLKHPADETALYELAELYQNLGRADDLFSTFDRIEEQLGLKVEIVRERQRILMKKRDLDGVVAEYRKLIDAYPHETSYRIEFINFLIQNDRLDEAGEEIASYEASGSTSSRITLLKSELAWMKEDKSEALVLLKDAFQTETLDFEAKFQILSNYIGMATGQSEQEQLRAIAVLLADQNPTEYKAQAFAGDMLFQVGEKEKAVGYYLQAIRISPANFSVWQNIINLEAEMNNYDSVVVHAEKALEYFPNQALLYYFAGTGHLIKNDYKKSVRALEQGKKYTIDPDLLTIFYGQLGDAYNGLEDHDKSDNSYEKALENKPDNDHVLNNYSYFLSLRKKNLDKALKMSTTLIGQHPDNPTYLDTHGWVLYVNGKFRESRKFLEKAADLDEDGTVIEHYGDVLFQLGEVGEALKQWERAREAGGASEHIDKKIADQKLYE